MDGMFMRTIIFNVEHGLCAFTVSPNGYGLLYDCGNRERFSPIKYVRMNYNAGGKNIRYHKGRRFAEFVVSHPHADHLSDIYRISKTGEDKPKILFRSKHWNKPLQDKVDENSSENGRERSRLDVLRKYKDFQAEYTEETESPDWGFDFFKILSLSKDEAWEVSSNNVDKYFNNSSNILIIGFAGRKILVPGDIEVEGWKKLLENEKYREALMEVNFFVASHHGHKSGFTSEIIEITGKPDLFIVSARSGDEQIDSSYSNRAYSKGFRLKGDSEPSRMVSTRERNGAIVIDVYKDGKAEVYVERNDDNLSKDQANFAKKKAARALRHL